MNAYDFLGHSSSSVLRCIFCTRWDHMQAYEIVVTMIWYDRIASTHLSAQNYFTESADRVKPTMLGVRGLLNEYGYVW